jgi:3-mercaptopyruvate sulfurtransferase SseA
MKYSRFNKANSTATEPGRTADLVEFGRAVADGKTLIVDARPGLFFREAHVPGAISLPRDDFDAIYARSAAWLESRRDTPVIVYCSDRSCEDAVLVARALASLGYSDVRVFSGGWAEWNTRAIFPDNTAHGR